MGEEEPVNEVSQGDSNAKSMPKKASDEMTRKKDLETDGGKVLKNNGVKEYKGVSIKENDEKKKADGVEEVKGDKKDDVVKDIIEDKKYNCVEETKEGKQDHSAEVKGNKGVNAVKEIKEDKEVAGVKEGKGDQEVGDVKKVLEDKKDDCGLENEIMDVDTGVKKTNDSKENKKVEAEKPEVDEMEVDGNTKDFEEDSKKEKIEAEMVEEDEDNIDKSKEGKAGDSKDEKGLKRLRRGKINNGEKDAEKRKDLKKTEPRTLTIDRPVRERKSVERLVASIEKDATKEFCIEKGHGTPLKDIPNVAFKLSRRKTDDTFKLLHTILFGRRGKAVQIKSNISRFSGFVWQDNEEKHMIKVKEKFDKCNKEKLLEFCDVFDIKLAKSTTRKSRKKNEDSSLDERKSTTDTEIESEEEDNDKENEEENDNAVPDKFEDDTPEKSESGNDMHSGNESEDDKKGKILQKCILQGKNLLQKVKLRKLQLQKSCGHHRREHQRNHHPPTPILMI